MSNVNLAAEVRNGLGAGCNDDDDDGVYHGRQVILVVGRMGHSIDFCYGG